MLIRAASDEALRTRWEKLLRLASDGTIAAADVPSFRPLRGDITQPQLGLDHAAASQLCSHVEEIIHSAATVDFDEPLDSCRVINVVGTQNLIDLARDCPKLKKFGHVSTLYVAGRRKGDVTEDDLEHDDGFVTNGYEQSKYEAEILVRQHMGRLPITVYRMSLLMGCLRDGYVHDYGAIHRFLMFMYRGIAPCFPGLPDCPLDFLPYDYSAECLMRLFNDHFTPGATYQISAGDRSATTRRWLELTAETYANHSRAWSKGTYNMPDIVSWPTYNLYKKTIATIDNLEFMKVIRILDSCAEECFCPKVFRREKLNQVLDVTRDSIPDYEEYYPRILRHCIEMNWGLAAGYERA
jgi:long-chain acyl-CoA synthetase